MKTAGRRMSRTLNSFLAGVIGSRSLRAGCRSTSSLVAFITGKRECPGFWILTSGMNLSGASPDVDHVLCARRDHESRACNSDTSARFDHRQRVAVEQVRS